MIGTEYIGPMEYTDLKGLSENCLLNEPVYIDLMECSPDCIMRINEEL